MKLILIPQNIFEQLQLLCCHHANAIFFSLSIFGWNNTDNLSKNHPFSVQDITPDLIYSSVYGSVSDLVLINGSFWFWCRENKDCPVLLDLTDPLDRWYQHVILRMSSLQSKMTIHSPHSSYLSLSQGPPGLPGLKGDTGIKGEKVREANSSLILLINQTVMLSR